MTKRFKTYVAFFCFIQCMDLTYLIKFKPGDFFFRKRTTDPFTLLTIQVVFGGDPEAALIQYTKNEEARRAISSTEAVLNNRFIRVHWHRELSTNTTGPPEQNPGIQSAGLAPSQGLEHGNMHKVSMKRWNKHWFFMK